jgi:hypothetical protein
LKSAEGKIFGAFLFPSAKKTSEAIVPEYFVKF